MKHPRFMKHARLISTIVILAMLLPTARVSAQAEGPAPQTSAAISALIEQLSAQEWQQRNDAQNKLIEIGEGARPMIQQAIDTSDNPEVRVRAQAIIAQLDENKSIGATPITLHLKDVTIQEVFNQLSEKYGTKFVPYSESMWRNGDMNRQVTLDIDNKPFWTAMQEITRVTGVGLTQWGDGLRLNNSQNQRGIEQVSGPCLFILQGASYNRSVQFQGNAQPSVSFQISMTVMIEPKVHVLRAEYQPQLEAAIDDKGNNLIPPADPRRGRGYTNGNNGSMGMGVQLVYPENPGKHIARLKGAVDMLVRSKSEKIEIADIRSAKNVTKTVSTSFAGDVKVTFVELETTGQQYTAKVVIEAEQPWPQQQYGSMYDLLQQMELQDANGVSLWHGGGGGSGSDRRIEGTVSFQRSGNGIESGEPVKLVWDFVTEVKPVSVPFEFTDLPMP